MGVAMLGDGIVGVADAVLVGVGVRHCGVWMGVNGVGWMDVWMDAGEKGREESREEGSWSLSIDGAVGWKTVEWRGGFVTVQYEVSFVGHD